MSVTIERAKPEDAEAIVPLQIAAFHHDAVMYPGVKEDGPPGYDSVDYVRRMIEEEDYYTIKYDGALVGAMSVFAKGEGHWHLDVIFVAPEYHGLGIGSRAMEFLFDRYQAPKWTLDTPTYAIRNQHFYEKFGFVITGEFPADGITLYSYERNA